MLQDSSNHYFSWWGWRKQGGDKVAKDLYANTSRQLRAPCVLAAREVIPIWWSFPLSRQSFCVKKEELLAPGSISVGSAARYGILRPPSQLCRQYVLHYGQLGSCDIHSLAIKFCCKEVGYIDSISAPVRGQTWREDGGTIFTQRFKNIVRQMSWSRNRRWWREKLLTRGRRRMWAKSMQRKTGRPPSVHF